MKNHSLRPAAGLVLLAAATLGLLVWNICAGSVYLPPGEVLAALLSPEEGGIVWGIRLPRVLAAAILGGALSVSGFLLQTFFANPIAGPFVLGISSGAKLTVALALVAFLSRGVLISSMAMVAVAFAGSMISMGFVLLMSRRVRNMSMLVVCVRGDVIARQGPPEEIFTPEYIADLYGAARGSYNALYGSLELEAPSGPPEVFVIGGGGAGIPVYRRLQRQGTPFAAGVLAENDLDYPVAQALAAETVSEKPFRPIGDGAFRRAAAVMERCARVLCPVAEFGAMNEGNRLLRELARDRGTLADGTAPTV